MLADWTTKFTQSRPLLPRLFTGTEVWSGGGSRMSQYKGCPLTGKFPLNSSLLHLFGCLVIMPADWSSFNQHNFQTAQGWSSVPYPSTEEAFRWSNTSSPTDDFSLLGLSDFFITHQQVVHHQLDHLALGANLHGLLSQGVGVGLEHRKPYNAVLEASISYASAIAVADIDEVAFVEQVVYSRLPHGLL